MSFLTSKQHCQVTEGYLSLCVLTAFFQPVLLELRILEVVVTTGTIRCATPSFLQGGPDALPAAQPTVSKHRREWKTNIVKSLKAMCNDFSPLYAMSTKSKTNVL